MTAKSQLGIRAPKPPSSELHQQSVSLDHIACRMLLTRSPLPTFKNHPLAIMLDKGEDHHAREHEFIHAIIKHAETRSQMLCEALTPDLDKTSRKSLVNLLSARHREGKISEKPPSFAL